MFKNVVKLLLILSITGVVGCSTSGTFIVPEGSELYLGGREKPVNIGTDGEVRTHGFGWGHIGVPPERGVAYKLEKDGEVIQEGRLRSKFRAASIFIPIYGILACPVGLNPDITYDLINGTQE